MGSALESYQNRGFDIINHISLPKSELAESAFQMVVRNPSDLTKPQIKNEERVLHNSELLFFFFSFLFFSFLTFKHMQ